MVERVRNNAITVGSRYVVMEISGRPGVVGAAAYLFELTLSRWWAVWVLVLKYSSGHQNSK